MEEVLRVKWACPKCGATATANRHGKGGAKACEQTSAETCDGFLCECLEDGTYYHGETFTDVCHEAHCYHCGWGGKFPQTPKKIAPWEKKALAEGWKPPSDRANDLGVKVKKEGS